ncbi:acyl-CoA carboxylase subunit epsilon [Streptomyces sp. NPDC053542]|uniref:acyl-CoA carboxylase subunit epsilon n=1 Tax=Streptomyces sp. NPDC053542 TaxID=3365710 RepID=UPI0037D5BC0A
MSEARDVIRVEKGSPTPEELAAVTAVLLRVMAAAPEDPAPLRPAAARWRRLERAERGPGPRSWQELAA